mgnify:CR=1 FL=1
MAQQLVVKLAFDLLLEVTIEDDPQFFNINDMLKSKHSESDMYDDVTEEVLDATRNPDVVGDEAVTRLMQYYLTEFRTETMPHIALLNFHTFEDETYRETFVACLTRIMQGVDANEPAMKQQLANLKELTREIVSEHQQQLLKKELKNFKAIAAWYKDEPKTVKKVWFDYTFGAAVVYDHELKQFSEPPPENDEWMTQWQRLRKAKNPFVIVNELYTQTKWTELADRWVDNFNLNLKEIIIDWLDAHAKFQQPPWDSIWCVVQVFNNVVSLTHVMASGSLSDTDQRRLAHFLKTITRIKDAHAKTVKASKAKAPPVTTTTTTTTTPITTTTRVPNVTILPKTPATANPIVSNISDIAERIKQKAQLADEQRRFEERREREERERAEKLARLEAKENPEFIPPAEARERLARERAARREARQQAQKELSVEQRNQRAPQKRAAAAYERRNGPSSFLDLEASDQPEDEEDEEEAEEVEEEEPPATEETTKNKREPPKLTVLSPATGRQPRKVTTVYTTSSRPPAPPSPAVSPVLVSGPPTTTTVVTSPPPAPVPVTTINLDDEEEDAEEEEARALEEEDEEAEQQQHHWREEGQEGLRLEDFPRVGGLVNSIDDNPETTVGELGARPEWITDIVAKKTREAETDIAQVMESRKSRRLWRHGVRYGRMPGGWSATHSSVVRWFNNRKSRQQWMHESGREQLEPRRLLKMYELVRNMIDVGHDSRTSISSFCAEPSLKFEEGGRRYRLSRTNKQLDVIWQEVKNLMKAMTDRANEAPAMRYSALTKYDFCDMIYTLVT